MQLEPHVRAIQLDLAAAASLGDDALAEAGRRLSEAVESSLGLRILDLLNDAALGLSSALPDGHVEIRLAGRDPELVYVRDDAAVEPDVSAGESTSARISLRLPESIKAQVESAADREGISTNAWVVRALARALDDQGAARRRRSGNQLRGLARS